MSLAVELNAVYTDFHSTAPVALTGPIKKSTSDFVASFNANGAIKVGDKLPSFRLSDASGKEVDSASLIANGPLLITFYRGNWCPFCNLALRALQKHLEDFKAKGVTLVAITPELPDTSLSTTEKNELEFTVLSDVGNVFAKKLGITFQQPNDMRSVFDTIGINFKERNGDDSLVVPLPATLLVDKSGVVRNTFIDPDYVHRLEPTTALEWVDALKN
ncbi:AhpC-TSA-domain-containing protein [Mollisia scopiformis]|uniref:thioredoxin-dependent peroxiredoxin n=1 Tax=Mollisia scopiformis TaxID=149040 RepID=A0A194WVD2_MOLSC|nr:AhpC-TSA-domain-containing protein [Mollisia scopiformis]KUJ11629.1 AhpC-TSA-domain-containing protein [Mollisia scopiformis]